MPAPNGYDASSLLEIAARFPPYRQEGKGYKCTCPCHPDHDPSLDITMGDKGVPVVKCRAGCEQAKVWAAVRPPREPRPARPARDRLEGIHVYHDARGEIAFRVHRWRKPDGSKAMPQSRPDGKGGWTRGTGGAHKGALFHLPQLLAAPPDEPVVIAEGEAKVEALERLGVLATCNAGGAGKWTREHARHLAGRPVIVLPDNDPQGHAHAATILATLPHARTVQLPGLPHKGDILDWLKAGGTPEELRTLLLEGPPVALARAPASDRAPATDAAARSRAPAREDWTAGLLAKGKEFAAVGANVLHALREAPELRGRVRLNALSEQVEAQDMPWCQGRDWQPWLETDDELLAEWLAHRELFVKANLCGSCVATIAGANAHHPVRAYLAGLEWDGVPRLSLWLTTYLGAYDAPDEYIHAVGRAWLISLVARAVRPGCQVDHLLILEGPQGARKSSALRALVPDPAWFTDNISALGTKDSAQDLRGKWLIELSDLSAMKRTEVERIKAAISHPVDHYRPSYGRYSRDFPRQCVFAGTTNEHAYLFDSTGNRRFWCLKIARIDIDALKRDRGQLWAEARDALERGEKWHLEPAVELLASAEQAKRREEEPLIGPVLEWVAETAKPEFFIIDIMRGIGIVDASKQNKADAMRIAAILRGAGCASRHTEHGKAWRRLTPADRCQEVSGVSVSPFVNDFNDIQKTDTSTHVLPQTLRARTPASDAGAQAHAHRVWPEKVSEVSAGAKPLKPNGDALIDTSLTPALTPAWAADWPTWDGRCGADPDCIKDWIALAGGGYARRSVTLPAACREHPEALKRLLSHITLQAWKVDWT